jgi:predicted dehydrogenase
MPVPARFTFVSPDTPPGEAVNVGQMYARFAQAIRHQRGRGDNPRLPNFDTAVDLHCLIDAIKEASDNGREVEFE